MCVIREDLTKITKATIDGVWRRWKSDQRLNRPADEVLTRRG